MQLAGLAPLCTCQRKNYSRVAENKHPDMPPLQRPLKDIQPKLSRSSYVRPPRPFFGQCNVILSQIKRPWWVWDAGEDDKTDQCHGNGEDTVDDKQPSPSRHARYSREIGVCCSLEISADHWAEWVAYKPHSSSLEEFGARVPWSFLLLAFILNSCFPGSMRWEYIPKIKWVPAKTGASNMPTKNRSA